jgi:HSP20 family protein
MPDAVNNHGSLDMKGGFMMFAQWNPFRELILMRDAMRQLFIAIRRMGGAKRETWSAGVWSPAVDIYETADAFILKAELPGYSKEDVTIEIRRHALLLRGARPREFEAAEEHYHCMERMSGAFQRSFLLPASIDGDKVTVSCTDGLLKLRLPKAKAARPGASASVSEGQGTLTQSGSP